ncbi:nicotinate-nucleotide adenylyltransferase [Mycoplasma zalophi]|uniref:Probable nicotinate-nucleotide adenylyltransferase n=1 Tax=Mycoplasma zalophi TaxID=191287 RepID=A0ABS6DRK3_9MOLU|nr:nicotinate-nucleotide adenylyltransferase [Mycoplasma zalophi]MBU4691324.1 nicotinate-nucleotide adenylyltransferase [Mycoplasma zalophi]MBU4692470.1 nicotinate-nucleotide adenylyltransferase [Mycoplasma zalophi]
MKIGLYGGTFDPITKGHIKIAKHAIENLSLDKLIFIPAYINPFKTKQKSVDCNHRFNMINLILEDKMEVSAFEINKKGPSYTIETLKYFKNKFPNDELFFLFGSDNLNSINKWKNIDEFKNFAQLVCYRRSNNINKINLKKYNIKMMNNTLYNFSSTTYRQGNISMVTKEVQNYIANNYLYLEDILRNTLSVNRYKHSKQAADFALKLADHLNYSKKVAYYAGLLHDITKEWTIDQHRNFLKRYNIDEKKIEDHQLHQKTGYLYLKNVLLIKNSQILKAIEYHTTLNYSMPTLSKIVYVADKICAGRAWEGIQEYRKLVFLNFDEGYKKLVLKIWNHYKENNYSLTEEQNNIYKKNI